MREIRAGLQRDNQRLVEPSLQPTILILSLVFLLFLTPVGRFTSFLPECKGEDVFKITAYCSCEKCCGKSDGITASGYKAREGYIACNWMPFGTQLEVEGLGTFVVKDRGAKSLFGSKDNHIKHLDIWFPTHKEAQKFGVKYLRVYMEERGR